MIDQLTIEHLSGKYQHKTVFSDISLSIRSNEIVGLLGPNGAGKTTCFYAILGLVAACGGKILLNNTDITKLKIHERSWLGIGYLPQEASIFRKLSVQDNLLAILELRSGLSRRKRYKLCEQLLEDFHLTALRDSMGYSLSGGERRRVEVARALALDPKFLLLDEPFAGVDPISIDDIKQIVRTVHARGVGILITDHNVRETLAICHRAYILNRGKLVIEGTPETILANAEVRKFYLGEHFTIN